ncbi:MAG: aspartate kinase [Planctomycetota bacterium]|nr:aspartate kinase [Planctomycetota bacterium]
MNRIQVLKFGGSALADGNAISRAAGLVSSFGGERPIVVVSALGGVTDLLLKTAAAAVQGDLDAQALRIRHSSVVSQLGLPTDLLQRLWRELYLLLTEINQRRELPPATRDLVLSFGERMSARIFAHTLRQRGMPATPVDAFDLGFETDSTPGLARLLDRVPQQVGRSLGQVPGVPVVTGFLAKDAGGNLTTLGRDGSDLTAAVIARAVGAKCLQYWKDVRGIHTADPRWVPGADSIDQISFGEARELAFGGAQVLQPASLQMASELECDVQVRSFLHPEHGGTQLTQGQEREGPVALACRPRLLGIEYNDERPHKAQAKLSAALVRLGIAGIVVRQVSISGAGAKLWFDDTPEAHAVLDQLPPATNTSMEEASISLVGHGLGTHPELLRRVLEVMGAAEFEVRQAQWGVREHGQTFIVPRECLAQAQVLLHDTVVGNPLLPH